MTTIIGHSELLKNGKLSPTEKEKILTNLIEQGLYLRNLVQKLMSLIQLPHIELNLEKVEFKKVFEKVKTSLAYNYPEKKIAYFCDFSVKSWIVDQELFIILIQNILENSYRHLSKNGTIKIRSFVRGQQTILEIKDDGCGIPQAELSKITHAFYRVDKTRSKTHGGLGLSICQKICELHQAQFVINSDIDVGTTVQIIFTKTLQVNHNSLKTIP